MLVDQVFNAVEVLLLPIGRCYAAHSLCCFGKVGRHLRIAVVKVSIGRVGAVVGNASQWTLGVAGVRGGKPVKAVGEVLAYAKAQSSLARGLLIETHNVAHRANGGGIPVRLVL